MIRELRPGVWEVIVYRGIDPDTGKKRRVSRTVHGSREDAAIRERTLRDSLDERRLRKYLAVRDREVTELLLRPPGAVVYQIFNDRDELIYVGVTHCIFQRMAAHLDRSRFASEAFRVAWENFPTRSEALEAERTLIAENRPRFNVAGAA